MEHVTIGDFPEITFGSSAEGLNLSADVPTEVTELPQLPPELLIDGGMSVERAEGDEDVMGPHPDPTSEPRSNPVPPEGLPEPIVVPSQEF